MGQQGNGHASIRTVPRQHLVQQDAIGVHVTGLADVARGEQLGRNMRGSSLQRKWRVQAGNAWIFVLSHYFEPLDLEVRAIDIVQICQECRVVNLAISASYKWQHAA